MFCKFCGNPMDDGALFCSKCGKAQAEAAAVPAASAPAAPAVTPAEERAGMSIYLNDICTLEFVINKLKTKPSKLQTDIQWYQNYNFCKDYWAADGKAFVYHEIESHLFKKFLFGFDGNNYWFGFNYYPKIGYVSNDLGLFHPQNRENYYHVLTDGYISSLTAPIKQGYFFQKRVNCDSFWFNNYGRYDRGIELRNRFIECWDDFQSIAPTEFQKQQKACEDLQNQLTQVESGIAKATSLLEKEYALNIIPSKFRNLAAMYYICDYFNSSSEPLTSILLQLNLDEIKSKLDTIIANQQQIIINQAIQISQNEQIIAQNEQTLKKLSSLEKSAVQNVQWTQVAANNAEACALIAAAQYIRSA